VSSQPRTPEQIAVLVRGLRSHGWGSKDIARVLHVDLAIVLAILEAAV
jgi:transcriptional regulator